MGLFESNTTGDLIGSGTATGGGVFRNEPELIIPTVNTPDALPGIGEDILDFLTGIIHAIFGGGGGPPGGHGGRTCCQTKLDEARARCESLSLELDEESFSCWYLGSGNDCVADSGDCVWPGRDVVARRDSLMPYRF